jgi:hypothetical protein
MKMRDRHQVRAQPAAARGIETDWSKPAHPDVPELVQTAQNTFIHVEILFHQILIYQDTLKMELTGISPKFNCRCFRGQISSPGLPSGT